MKLCAKFLLPLVMVQIHLSMTIAHAAWKASGWAKAWPTGLAW
jgi:hypothetical protein